MFLLFPGIIFSFHVTFRACNARLPVFPIFYSLNLSSSLLAHQTHIASNARICTKNPKRINPIYLHFGKQTTYFPMIVFLTMFLRGSPYTNHHSTSSKVFKFFIITSHLIAKWVTISATSWNRPKEGCQPCCQWCRRCLVVFFSVCQGVVFFYWLPWN